ncbi:MAG: DUF6291 domain-containing protein [Thermincola sp.]|nr:DUF6291 domain-containing protein [Thermincola sp.]MDT3702680.1 DUF6291 domain-containing protein [Thermincola sp.]
MSVKKSFILYHDYRQHLELLSDEDKGKLLMALFDYSEGGVLPNFDGMARMAFSFIRAQIDRDTDKYSTVCQRNRENGSKGGRPPKQNETE